MKFLQVIKRYFARWNDFKGRTSRSEYWWTTFFVTLVSIFSNILTTTLNQSESPLVLIGNLLITVVSLFVMMASITGVVRRLHDINKSDW
jgi:uncharacterized membrane protein YhaH (DUF805 family)